MEEFSPKSNFITYLSGDDEYTIHYLSSRIEYKKNGIFHRENGPAIIHNNGKKEWWINGKCHRDNDLPAIEYSNGNKSWWKNGELHRENDLPAIENKNGSKAWCKEGKYHRLMGPAIIYSDGREEYWIEGKIYTKEEFDEKVKELLCA